VSLHLTIAVPAAIAVDVEVRKLTAEAVNGSFCLLPRHVDIVTALVPSLLCYETPEGEERFVAVDGGVLVKCAGRVLVATPQAFPGGDLGSLRATVQERFALLDERERTARAAVRKLEAGFVRRFLQLEEVPGG
jgi:F-type H+-transporting ATPase subunit epsilon